MYTPFYITFEALMTLIECPCSATKKSTVTLQALTNLESIFDSLVRFKTLDPLLLCEIGNGLQCLTQLYIQQPRVVPQLVSRLFEILALGSGKKEDLIAVHRKAINAFLHIGIESPSVFYPFANELMQTFQGMNLSLSEKTGMIEFFVLLEDSNNSSVLLGQILTSLAAEWNTEGIMKGISSIENFVQTIVMNTQLRGRVISEKNDL
jgi:hypothetical protein